ncbi:MAG: hypothetical protein GX892_04990 [Thermoanaerobacteraceae bacterium]|nr:hypothetical protein [Thermoanaerobacteraceae bacterium]
MEKYRQELSRILQSNESDSLMEKINQLSMVLGDPQQARQVENVLKGILQQQQNSAVINLFNALLPFLNKENQEKVRKYKKVLNTLYLIQTIQQPNK